MNAVKDQERPVVGVVEWVKVKGEKGMKKVKAKVDTGAARTSIDSKLSSVVGLVPLADTVQVRSAVASTPTSRPIMRAEIIIHQQRFTLRVSVEDRSKMKYPVLIGRDLLQESNFIIDPVI
jgi:hypothetical protein